MENDDLREQLSNRYNESERKEVEVRCYDLMEELDKIAKDKHQDEKEKEKVADQYDQKKAQYDQVKAQLYELQERFSHLSEEKKKEEAKVI